MARVCVCVCGVCWHPVWSIFREADRGRTRQPKPQYHKHPASAANVSLSQTPAPDQSRGLCWCSRKLANVQRHSGWLVGWLVGS
uniref:Putative secreted protein n=1 Tax=Anopheles darlingi TaxID=43151 RepID=A0A2M4D515_ANODA